MKGYCLLSKISQSKIIRRNSIYRTHNTKIPGIYFSSANNNTKLQPMLGISISCLNRNRSEPEIFSKISVRFGSNLKLIIHFKNRSQNDLTGKRKFYLQPIICKSTQITINISIWSYRARISLALACNRSISSGNFSGHWKLVSLKIVFVERLR